MATMICGRAVLTGMLTVVFGSLGCGRVVETGRAAELAHKHEPVVASRPDPCPAVGFPIVNVQADERVVTGTLDAVDLHGRTLTIRSADGPITIGFSDRTLVFGASGPQGLAPQPRQHATVYYGQAGESRIATGVELHCLAADSPSSR